MSVVMEYCKTPYHEVGGNFFDFRQKCIFELIDKQYTSSTIKDFRKAGVEKAFKICREYLNSKCSMGLVMKVLDKKVLMIMNSSDKKEIEDILKMSTPQYLDNGFVVTSKYHIPEEELLLLMIANKMGTLSGAAQVRFVSLYNAFIKSRFEVDLECLEEDDEF